MKHGILKITNEKERNNKNKMAKTHDFTVADTRAESAMASMTSYAIASISTNNSR